MRFSWPCSAVGPSSPGYPRRAGVKNIHAYSWLAHARKYLESIAREKKHASARKKFSSRASGNWDHHSNLVDHIDRCCLR